VSHVLVGILQLTGTLGGSGPTWYVAVQDCWASSGSPPG